MSYSVDEIIKSNLNQPGAIRTEHHERLAKISTKNRAVLKLMEKFKDKENPLYKAIYERCPELEKDFDFAYDQISRDYNRVESYVTQVVSHDMYGNNKRFADPAKFPKQELKQLESRMYESNSLGRSVVKKLDVELENEIRAVKNETTKRKVAAVRKKKPKAKAAVKTSEEIKEVA